MNNTGSLKEKWDEINRERFQWELLKHGWEVYQTLKESTIFQKATTRIEVDDFGAWLFEFNITAEGGRFVRTHGISDDRIDDIYAPGHDRDILSFQKNHIVKRFNLETAEWVKAE